MSVAHHLGMLFIFVNLCIRCKTHQGLKIGGIFNISEENEEIAFKLAVKMANNVNQHADLHISAQTIFVDHTNVLKTNRAACELLQSQVVAIFGPSSAISSPHVQSMCDTKEMPHVETHWDTRKCSNFERNLVNLHPYPQTLAKVYVDIVRAYKWKTFTILYDTDEALSQVDELLTNGQEFQVQIRQLELDISWTYRGVLNMLKKSGELNYILACSIEVLIAFLEQAQHVGLITERFNYLVMNLDMYTLNLVTYQYAGCNITGVRLLDPELNDIIEVADNLSRIKQKLGKPIELASHLAAWKINLKTALLIDAVSLFYESLKDIQEAKRFEPKTLYCNVTENWEHGYSIINNMKTRTWNGLSGQIKFDTQGVRSEFLLDVVELSEGGLIKVGVWNSTEGLNITRVFHTEVGNLLEEEGILQNKSFIVITALTKPYGFLKDTTTQLSGNDRFEGFGIDLIHELSLMLGFNYTFVIQEDGSNGNYDRETKQWNGMIREIIDGRAHLAITDLTITSERQSAVDFTMPFMNLGISILYRKPKPVPPSLFTFASPFSIQVWMLLGVAYFFVSISLFLIGRICPSEWTNPYPCVDDPEYLINQFTMKNSLWFTIGSLMQQGTEIAPIGISTRMVAGIWWFFTLIMVSSYTANLAAFLTVETLVTSFKNIDELAQQNEIKYGAKGDGATSNFFRDSNLPAYKKIWTYMHRNPDVMTLDNDIGVKRVVKENYAFLMESTTIEYMVERYCTLAQVGGLLDDKGYGIAMKKDSKMRNILSAAVLKLQETGKLTALKIKWWKEQRGGGNCVSGSGGGQATPLGLKNVEGVFFILTLGTILGMLGTFVELAVHVLHTNYKNKRKLRENFRETYMEELRFIFKFKERVKRLQSANTSRSSVDDDNELLQDKAICRRPEVGNNNAGASQAPRNNLKT